MPPSPFSFTKAAQAAAVTIACVTLAGAVEAHDARSLTRVRGATVAPVAASSVSVSLPFITIADLDEASKDTDSTKLSFFSYLQHGTLEILTSADDTPEEGDDDEDSHMTYRVKWGERERATSSFNDGGRGFELSELVWYHDQLRTVDDRTGLVFELTGFDTDEPLRAIPQSIVMEGNGVAAKGQKHEWATVKDDELFLGSSGVAIKDDKGEVDAARQWVAVLDANHDVVRHVDWRANYERVRDALHIRDPGYVTHEAVVWSDVHSKWFLLPRRASKQAFNETEDAFRSTNWMIIASENFDDIDLVEIGDGAVPERGFSSFQFVPGSHDTVILAIKSVEIEDKLNAFMTVFDIDGNVLLGDVEIPGDAKYEGFAFIPQ